MKSKFSHLWQKNKPAVFAGAVILVTLITVGFHLFDRARFIRSDDALVQAHFTTLTTKVPGMVESILVRELEHVKKGQVLARIDSSDYRFQKIKQASAVESAQIHRALEAKDYARAIQLHRDGAISDQDLHKQETSLLSAGASEDAAMASVDTANLNIGYTEIKAPADGIIAGMAIEVGMMLDAGDPLYGFVYPETKWIDARIKEGDLPDLKVGEKAEVQVDAIPGKTFAGTIESIAPSTEGIEAAIPPDNGAGNYTKYVQRVPVRIALDLNPEEQEEMRVGLSAEVNIRRVQ
jgi:membrane fusion protein (multidrug efflux system)